jgi:uncharacterized membrane protein
MIGPVELIIAAFNEQNKAGEALKTLRELEKQQVIWLVNAAIMTKDAKGKVSIKETQDVDARHGALFGAITGGLIGLLGGPAGVVVGAAAGAATGGAVAHKVDMGFPEVTLKEIQSTLKPGSSAILALIQHEWVDRVAEELDKVGATLFRQALKEEVAAQLDEGQDETKPDETKEGK